MKPIPARLVLMIACISLFCIAVSFTSVLPSRAWAVSPEGLPKDIRDLVIEENYVPSPFPVIGAIQSLRGTVVVVHRADGKAYFGSEGDPIHENDEFHTLADSRCRLRFINEDVISLGADTRFSVDTYNYNKEGGENTSAFTMAGGKAMFYAMRLFNYRQARFQVRTPTAVMSVQGGRFGAHVHWPAAKTAHSSGVQVADSGGSMGSYFLAQVGGEGTPITDVGVGDGYVEVNGVFLGPGQYYNSYTGEITYDPEWLEWLSCRTDRENGECEGEEGEGERGGGEGEGEEGNGNGLDGDDGDPGDMDDAASNIISTLTGSGIMGAHTGSGTQGEPTTPGGDPTPDNGDAQEAPRSGYFATMLQVYLSGELYVQDVFLSKTPGQFEADDGLRAGSLFKDESHVIWKGGREGKDGEYSWVKSNEFGRTIDQGIAIATAREVVKEYEYLKYGKWEHPGTFSSGEVYRFVDHSWWLEGHAGPDYSIASQKGILNYSGDAHGTIFHWAQDAWGNYSSQATSGMDGTFISTVNFDTATVQGFNMNVTGGGFSAEIIGAGGSIAADGTFSLSGGTWSLQGQSPGHKEAYGRFFGPNAEEMGGNWAMYRAQYYAVGVFCGKR